MTTVWPVYLPAQADTAAFGTTLEHVGWCMPRRCSNLPWSLKVDVGAGGKIWPLGVVKKAAEFLLGTKDPSYTFEPEALKIPLLDQKFCDKLPEALAPVIRNSICCVGRADPFPGIGGPPVMIDWLYSHHRCAPLTVEPCIRLVML